MSISQLSSSPITDSTFLARHHQHYWHELGPKDNSNLGSPSRTMSRKSPVKSPKPEADTELDLESIVSSFRMHNSSPTKIADRRDPLQPSGQLQNRVGKASKSSGSPSKIPKLSTADTPRRSRRLFEKTVDVRERSPERRCEPHHRENLPTRPLLKRADRPGVEEARGSPGFYSAEELRRYTLKESATVVRSPDESSSSKRERKSVAWNEELEWS